MTRLEIDCEIHPIAQGTSIVNFMIRQYPDLVCYDDETYNGNLSENFLLRCNSAANYSRLNKQ
jgi:hypothetical protein